MDRATLELLFRIECRMNKIENVSMDWLASNVNDRLASAYGKEMQVRFAPRLLVLSDSNVIDIIRHELSHLMDYRERGQYENENGRDVGHGKNWKKWCRLLGAKPNAKITLTLEEWRKLKGFDQSQK